MAALSVLNQALFGDAVLGRTVSYSEIRPSGGSDTVVIPECVRSANHVRVICDDPADTAATVSSITQGDVTTNPGTTVNLTGGTANAKMFVIAFHSGNVAGL